MTGPHSLRVARLGWPIGNIWLLPSTPIGPILVDSGFSSLWPLLKCGLRGYGLEPHQLAAIILTHRHSDHAGNASRLATEYGVPIYAHACDAHILSGLNPRPWLPSSPSIAGLMSRVENNRPSHIRSISILHEGDRCAGLVVFWMPGHTRGSIFLYHPPSRSLFSGDALLNAVPPLTWRTNRLSLPYPDFCEDYERALRSLKYFVDLQLPVDHLYPGHGPARHSPFHQELLHLLAAAACEGYR